MRMNRALLNLIANGEFDYSALGSPSEVLGKHTVRDYVNTHRSLPKYKGLKGGKLTDAILGDMANQWNEEEHERNSLLTHAA